MADFVHLHVHSHYSMLDGATDVVELVREVKRQGSPAIALTDHGNLHGIVDFVLAARKEGIKPIIGCEFYLAERHRTSRNSNEKTYHQLLLAYNSTGYQNLIKLSSLAFVEGFYRKPRIDKELLKKYSDGLIATSCCLAAEIPQTILREGEDAAKEKLKEWLDIFGPDRFYLEVQRHGPNDDEQQRVNEVLFRWADEFGLKTVATNDVHYLHKKDAEAHDILLTLQTGAKLSDPNRFRFDSDEYYLKTPAEMARQFAAHPEAVENTLEVAERIEDIHLERDVLLPHFPIPAGFDDAFAYLRHLTYQGARRRYQTITNEIEQRIESELNIIRKMGYEGYFLIVQDFINAARNAGISVGPGRGSAVGSVVGYCLGITNADPLKYDLLFERFLNPERISMPDIDIDFEDRKRDWVIQYVAEKYGRANVGQIVTYGVMKARSAIRDVGRVLGIPLKQVDRIAKLIPHDSQQILEIPEIKKIYQEGDADIRRLIEMAERLKGVIRHRSKHAAGVIIAPGELSRYIPVCVLSDSASGAGADGAAEAELLVSQYDMRCVEKVGMLKMDFLGLRTLSIIEDAVDNIEQRTGRRIDMDALPLDDKATYELYQRGETVGTFQFESEGMRSWLRQIKPTEINDLIALNALYRPGPMDYIPHYVRRKHGQEEVQYPHPILKDILRPTYGIFVYQEQIMQAAQVVAGFSLGKADILRRAMGKKKADEMARMEGEFIEGARRNGIDEKAARAIWEMMARFAEYGFNKSHAVAYALLAYQTAYLKANYPAEYMAAVLSNNMGSLDKVYRYISEAKRMGIRILGPDINESRYHFSVSADGHLRFGLGAVKNVGEKAVRHIIEERDRRGPFRDIYDFVQRVDNSLIQKNVMEALAAVGAFDGLSTPQVPIHRAALLAEAEGGDSFAATLVEYGKKVKEANRLAQSSLFGADAIEVTPPPVPSVPPWDMEQVLKKEKEFGGFYFSGHPLEKYRAVLPFLVNASLAELQAKEGEFVRAVGVIQSIRTRRDREGNRYAYLQLEDMTGEGEVAVFSQVFNEAASWLEPERIVYVEGSVRVWGEGERAKYSIGAARIMPVDEAWHQKKSLHMSVDLQAADETTADALIQLLSRHRGNKILHVTLRTPDQTVETRAAHGVDLSPELIEQLKQVPHITFAVH